MTGKNTTTSAGVANAAKQLLDQGARQVVITMGELGVLLATRGQVEAIPAFHVQAIDTTAAGDAFNGGLACALARGDAMREAICYASAVAALSVTRFGAQPSLPSRNEVETFLKSQTWQS